jgi:hypothetical protein
MGQGCLRFKRLEELALDVVEKTIAELPVKGYVAGYQAVREGMGKATKKAAKRG